jgi:hypothetical protein
LLKTAEQIWNTLNTDYYGTWIVHSLCQLCVGSWCVRTYFSQMQFVSLVEHYQTLHSYMTCQTVYEKAHGILFHKTFPCYNESSGWFQCWANNHECLLQYPQVTDETSSAKWNATRKCTQHNKDFFEFHPYSVNIMHELKESKKRKWLWCCQIFFKLNLRWHTQPRLRCNLQARFDSTSVNILMGKTTSGHKKYYLS